jgi:Bacterial protein of unknown function (DUF839)
MAVRYGSRAVNQSRPSIQITARSLLLVSSGTVRKCEKESMMAKFKKRMVKWGLSAAKVGLAASILAAPAVSAQASEFDGFDGLDFGALVQRGLERSSLVWFGVGKPLKESAAPTSGPYRTAAQNASAQVLLAEGLKAEYVTRNAGNAADMFAFWPSDENPTHLVFCIEGDREDLGVPLPGAGVNKLNPGVQRIRLSTGSVDTLVRGTDSCDGIRRTPWGTILFTEEASDGGAYEIIDPLNVINHTITNRAAGTIIDETGVITTKVIKRPALPTMAWEGIGILPSGVLYAGDELRPGTATPNADGGAMFKFIPVNVRTATTPITMLSESPFAAGNVWALQVSCQSGNQQFGQGCEIGNGSWVSISAANARIDANTAGATGYYRPEDLEIDEEFEGPGVRFCWTNTGNAGGKNYGEVICGVDSAPDQGTSQRTVTVNRFVEGDADFNAPDNFAFQPKTGNHYVIEDNPNGDIFACLPDGGDHDIKTDGCVKILSVKDSSAEPTGFKFSADGRTAYLSIQHSNDGLMSKFDDYATDDIIKITGFKIPFRFQR